MIYPVNFCWAGTSTPTLAVLLKLSRALEISLTEIMSAPPHVEGTREYFTCIEGEISVTVLGEVYRLKSGDVLTFPGYKPHHYKNNSRDLSRGFSVVLYRPTRRFSREKVKTMTIPEGEQRSSPEKKEFSL
jgi:uncharacterized cupin superfamily protein